MARDTPLWLYAGWESLDISSWVVKILLRDILGYRNISVAWGGWAYYTEPLRSMGGPVSSLGIKAESSVAFISYFPHEIPPHCQDNVCVNNGISAGAGWPCFFHERNDIWYGPDAFLEHWPAGWAAMENTMLYQEKSVFDLGVPTPLLSCGPAITVVATKMCHVGAGPIGYFGANGLYVTGFPLCHPPVPSPWAICSHPILTNPRRSEAAKFQGSA